MKKHTPQALTFDYDYTIETKTPSASIKCDAEVKPEFPGALEYLIVNVKGIVTTIAVYEKNVRGEKNYVTTIERRRGMDVSFKEEHYWPTPAKAHADVVDWSDISKKTDW